MTAEHETNSPIKFGDLPPIGCNVLYPFGELNLHSYDMFDVPAYSVALRRLKECGYQYIEYSHASHFTNEQLIDIRNEVDKLGLRPWSMHSSGYSLTKANREDWLNHRIREVHIAGNLGCRLLVMHIGEAESDEEWFDNLEYYSDVFTNLCQVAYERHLWIGLENGKIDRLMHLLDLVNCPNAGYVFDSGHAHLQDSIERTLDCMNGRILSTHLHDNFGRHDEHLPPALGRIDWKVIFYKLIKYNYSGPLMLELTDYPRNRNVYDQLTEVKQGILNIKTLWHMCYYD